MGTGCVPQLAQSSRTILTFLVSEEGKTMPDPFYGHQPAEGLHVLKDAWCQKAHFGVQSRELAESGRLSAAIAATFAAAPVRQQEFRLSRSVAEDIHESQQERRLESAMMRRWGSAGMWPVPGAWIRLVACQVPLFNQQLRDGWGYIDLLGVTTNGLPVVVELKKPARACADGKTDATETPLRMVLEAATYAIAIRKNWNHGFRDEWLKRLQDIDFERRVIEQLPERIEEIRLVAAAPASYWIDWLPVTDKGRTVSRETWESFRLLLAEFANLHLPVSFVSISGHDQNPNGLAVQPLSFPLVV